MRALGRRAFVLAFALGALVVAGCKREPAEGGEVTVAAATSLRKVFPKLSEGYAATHPGVRVSATYGASGELARQIEGGAGVDLVIVAARDPIDRLAAGGHVDAKRARVVATNELVLVGPKGGPKLTFQTLGTALPSGEKIAIGEPGAVPAGRYAREALEKLGVWKALEGRVVLGGNVAAVLAYVERGEVAAAIVYRTEVPGAAGIEVLDGGKGEWAPRPEVWAAVTTKARARVRADAEALLDFIAGPEGQRILASYGFGPIP
ncbi:molybdate ABC transporter substrate-binding protein [Polyangium jinanense]|uniref:Molybdate ABC transporter substrate-binding protein n=1 Tax=Polyangium jinanense TaxID=2829994 RepID=A0A9X3X7N2_9BACT|nr:molybdate ABC transporter substrate-binding protein [Polyangium jinanense]MDC3961293.1 molybdate ABC transporter substrate-binding protein [Polyangium jinanense]MDC3984075.1 molybdate ABC transporter substrate-binding protein [Polyangium jinanense]